MLDGLLARLRSIVRRDTVADEMEEELREHLEQATALHIRRGLSPDEARLAAKRDFGSTSLVVEDARVAWGSAPFDDVRRDVRHAVRALLRTPGFSVVVVITLAFGFGVNGAMLALVRGAMGASPIPQPETWVSLADLWSYSDYEYLRDSVRSLADLTATSEQSVLVRAHGDRPAEEVPAIFVSGNYFSGLRGRPLLGRTFGAEELAPPAGEPVAILSHRFWLRRFGGDSAVLGRGIRLGGGQAFTVVGVMPRDFLGTSLRAPDLWLPIGARSRLPGDGNQLRSVGDDTWFGAGGREFLFLGGRLASGASLQAVRAELLVRIAQRSAPEDSARAASVVAHLRTEDERAGLEGSDEMAMLGLVLASPLFVLLIASVTVANLMLARAAARKREMGIRVALGASRARVVRAWLTECLVLGGSAAGIGLLLSFAAVRGLTGSASLWPDDVDVDMEVLAARFTPDVGVVAYLAILAVVSTLIFGLAPIMRATTGDPLSSIRDSAGGSVRRDRVPLRSGLVIAQIAMTMMLLVTAGMLLRGLLHVAAVDTGFDRQEVMVVRPSLALSGYDTTRARLFIDELQARLMAVPGVQSVARGNVPFLNTAVATVERAGGEASGTATGGQFNAVSESFFSTLGIEIERGRAFTAEEVRQEAPVAILGATTARTLFPGEEALGKLVTIRPRVRGSSELNRGQDLRPAEGRFENARVVGIASDAMNRLGAVSRRYAYVPGDYWDLMVRRRAADAAAVDERIRTLAREIDPDVVLWTRSMEQVIRNSNGFIAIAPLITMIGAVLGLLSLALAVVGLYGLTAYAVEQRTREFGVRMALGARAGDVVGLVAGQSLRLVAIGAVVGLAAAAAGGGLLRSLVFGVRALDPLAYAGVILVLASVALLACYVPARRATRVDPMIALRSD
jgi:predicted permease